MSNLETEIRTLCQRQLGRDPVLTRPQGYNDKIQWLKLHDQRPEHVVCCDKLTARDWIAERVGKELLVPLIDDQYPRIIKPSHWSGGVHKVADSKEWMTAMQALKPLMTKRYGIGKGEWAYRMIPDPAIVQEVVLESPTDYKFHCSQGRVAWVQIIAERGTPGFRETITDSDGSVLPLHMDEKIRHAPDDRYHPGAAALREMVGIAEQLAAGWQYIRVDLYWSGGRPYVGELTFWPRAGCYKSADEPVFGRMLKLDLRRKRKPICV